MRATIYIDEIVDFDNIREMADLKSISSHPVRNMKEMRQNYYDKPNLVIEGRPNMLRPFIEDVKKMGFRVVID